MNGRRQVRLIIVALALVGCRPGPGPEALTAPAAPAAQLVPSPVLSPTDAVVVARTPVADVVDSLRGLTFDDFLTTSHNAMLARSPEHVTELGISGELGMRNDTLDDLSQAYVLETQALERAVLDTLRAYDRDALDPDRQLSYDVYEWYLDDLVRGQRFAENDYPVTHCRIGHHYGLMRLLLELHPLETPRDAEDYVARLSRVDAQVEQLLAGLERRKDAGVVLPRFIIEVTKTTLADYLGTTSHDPADVDAASLSIYTSFAHKLDDIAALDDAERNSLRARALAAIESSFVPAYLAQLDYLDRLADVATTDAGVWKLPDGDAYYAYLLRSQTTTDLTADEVHALGLREVARIHAELREAFDAMGYPRGLELAELVKRAVDEAGTLPMDTDTDRQAVIRAWETLVDNADAVVGEAFDLRPEAGVAVVGGPGGASYEPGAADGTVPCRFHVDAFASSQPTYMMPTIAYHEAIPGHHFQAGLERELGLPRFRTDIELPAFTEGWADYAERLTWELGLYDDDPYGNVGRLLCELLRAARIVTDTGIHARHWTRDEARAYLDETLGAAPGTFDLEVDRFVVAPARVTANEVGMLAILDMRSRAVAALGDDYDVKAFHNAVIGRGSMPIETLREVVDDYIEAAVTP